MPLGILVTSRLLVGPPKEKTVQRNPYLMSYERLVVEMESF
jgi:hypothetical protein